MGEKLGSFLAQISSRAIEEVEIECQGEVGSYGIAPITTAVLKGLLTPFVGETVNYVNAKVMAKDRGIKVTESISDDAEDFASLIAVSTPSKMERNDIAGTLFGKKELRIVRLNDFLIEAFPEGHLLLVKNYDKPGVIGNVGMALGSRRTSTLPTCMWGEIEGEEMSSHFSIWMVHCREMWWKRS